MPGEETLSPPVERVPYFVELRREQHRSYKLEQSLGAARLASERLLCDLQALRTERAGDSSRIAALKERVAQLEEERDETKEEVVALHDKLAVTAADHSKQLGTMEGELKVASSVAARANGRAEELARVHARHRTAHTIIAGMQPAAESVDADCTLAHLEGCAAKSVGGACCHGTGSTLDRTLQLLRLLLILRNDCIDEYDLALERSYGYGGEVEVDAEYHKDRVAFVIQMRDLEGEKNLLRKHAETQWEEEHNVSPANCNAEAACPAVRAAARARAVCMLLEDESNVHRSVDIAQRLPTETTQYSALWEGYDEHCTRHQLGISRAVPLLPREVPLERLLLLVEGVLTLKAREDAAAESSAEHLPLARALFLYLEERYALPGLVQVVGHGMLVACEEHAAAHAVIRLFAGVLMGTVHEAALRHAMLWRSLLAKQEHAMPLRSAQAFGQTLACLYVGARDDDVQDTFTAFETRISERGCEPTSAAVIEFLTEQLLTGKEVRYAKFARILAWKDAGSRGGFSCSAFLHVGMPLLPHKSREEMVLVFDEALAGEDGALGQSVASVDALAHVLSVVEMQ